MNRIVRDSRGLLWFCTNDGLSRFDGHAFLSFGTEQGLGDQEVTDVLKAADGTLWVGTARGLARMDTGGTGGAGVSFTNFLLDADARSQWVQQLLQDSSGQIWIATNGGLYRMRPAKNGTPVFQPVDLPDHRGRSTRSRVFAVLKDGGGRVWSGGATGLHRLTQEGHAEHYGVADGLPDDAVMALALDAGGALWVGTNQGLCRVAPRERGRAVVDRVYTPRDGLPSGYVGAIHLVGQWLWAGTLKGLARVPMASAGKLQVFGPAHGLRHQGIISLAEDEGGNLWIGTMGGGASRLTAGGFTTYSSVDGLASPQIAGILETNTGELCVISKDERHFALNRLDGNRFIAVEPRLPPGVTGFGWGWAQIALQDRFSEWWVATGDGVLRYPRASVVDLAKARPKAFFRILRELPPGNVFRLFEDSRGDIWISISEWSANGLLRWVRRTGQFEQFGRGHGLTEPGGDKRTLASAFAEDRAGHIWIGFQNGGLVRFRHGQFVSVGVPQKASLDGIRWIHRDGAGRLWIASRQGLLRVDQPDAERPVLTSYGTTHGLASNLALSITEDHRGRIYIGSGRGVDRLDPSTGQVRHYGPADGLVGGEIRVAYRDRHGDLWFGSAEGLSRHDPRQERRLPAPNVYISGVRTGSVTHEVAHTGQAWVSVPPVSWRHNSFHVEFMGVGEALRYQYRLDGVDAAWSELGTWRNAHYPGLEAGRYRFSVRAVNADGAWSPQAAAVHFQVEPPFWRTTWFRWLAAALTLAVAFVVHRTRIAAAVAVERVRNRIATDLHDDVAASLCHAALLSDLAQRDESARGSSARDRLEPISAVCREALDSMADIVWATDPQKDRMGDLVQRMRSFAEDMLASRGVSLRFADGTAPETVLPPEVRHQVFLVFKEAIHNVVRHSGAASVSVELLTRGQGLTLRIADDGCGLPAGPKGDGHGLHSMRERMAALGGTMRANTEAQEGTTLEFTVSLNAVRR